VLAACVEDCKQKKIMPFDQKRINGPENSFSYQQLIEKPKKLKVLKGKREDGRDWNESRKFGKLKHDNHFS
jgi:hypothetical protein